MTTFVLPTSESVSDLLKMLYGNGLRASDCSVDETSPYRVATFVDDGDNVVAAIACDVQFVVYSGAALSMIPSGGADDMVAAKKASDAALDNFHEVMNICSKLFMTETSAHLRLGKIIEATEAADSVSVQALEAAATKTGFEVEIPDYGSGKMVAIVT